MQETHNRLQSLFFVTKKEANTSRRPCLATTTHALQKPPNFATQPDKFPIDPARIDAINAIHSGYCYILISVWILSAHILSLERLIGQFYYFGLYVATTYFFLFKEPKTGRHPSEPSGHAVLRELIFSLQFLKDFFLMLAALQVESIFVYLVSYMSPNKYNRHEEPLNDTIRMFFESFSASEYTFFNKNLYDDIWLGWLCQNYIPTTVFVFVLWVVLLCFAHVQSPVIRCFKLLQKFCRCVAYSRLLRVVCFMSTIVPSSRYGCYIGRFSDFQSFEQIPERLAELKWWQEPFSWSKVLVWRTAGGCNDLIFSGHMTIIVTTLMVFSEALLVDMKILDQVGGACERYLKGRSANKKKDIENVTGSWEKLEIRRHRMILKHIKNIKIGMYATVVYLWWLSVVSGLKMITEFHHYSVDVLLAYIVTGLVYHAIGSRSVATNYGASTRLGEEEINTSKENIAGLVVLHAENDFGAKEPWWCIDILSSPTYRDWMENRYNVRSYNWIAKRFAGMGTVKSGTRLFAQRYNVQYQWYLIGCMFFPLFFVFVLVLPST